MRDLRTYKFRCSSLGKIMTGSDKLGLSEPQKIELKRLEDLRLSPKLSDKQQAELDRLNGKDLLTAKQSEFVDKMNAKLTAPRLSDKQTTAIGELIAKRDAKPKLSTTALSYLDKIIQEEVFGRTHEIRSKYLDKGLAVEQASINLYAYNRDMLFIKNDDRFYNEWITGEPDNKQDIIRDFKSSWDFSTFPLHATEIPTDMYKWQLDGYMWLTGLQQSELIYCLVDTPTTIIDDDMRRTGWKLGMIDLPKELIVEIASSHLYTVEGLERFCQETGSGADLTWFDKFTPIVREHRMKIFKHEYDQSRIDKLVKNLELARNYLVESQIRLGESLAA